MIIQEKQDIQLHQPSKTAEFIRRALDLEDDIGQEREHFWVIGLDTRNSVSYVELVSLGTLNQSLVHPREVFRHAIVRNVNSIIVAHNHPSGDVSPSDEDGRVTDRLKEAGEILGICVLDHIVVCESEKFYSFRQEGRL